MKRVASLLLVLQLLAAMLLCPALAIAQETSGAGMGAIAAAAKRPDDQSRQALVAVFGQVVNDPLSGGAAGGGDTLLASIFQVTNVALLTIGGAMCAWVVFRRVAGAASSGSVFDQGGTNLWAPLRVVWGLSSLIPTANGWSIAQLIMLWAASVMGVGTANLAVDGAAAALQAGKPLVMQPVASPTLDVARQLFAADLCMHGINYGLAQVASSGGLVDDSEYISQRATADGGGFTLTDAQGNFSCGGASIDAAQLQPQPQSTNAEASFDVSAIYQAHAKALAAMQATLSASAKDYVSDVLAVKQGQRQGVPSAEVAIQSAAAAYEGTVQAAVGERVGDIRQLSGQLVDNLKTQGWWMLGSWYQTFAQANQKLSDAVAAKASIAAPSPQGAPGPTDVWRSADGTFRAEEANQVAAATIGEPTSAEQTLNQAGSTEAVFKSIFSPGQATLRGLLEIEQPSSNNTQVNPLIALKNMGDRVMGFAEGAFVAMAGVDVAIAMSRGWSVIGLAAKVANGVSGVRDALVGLWRAAHPYLFLVILALFMFGITLSVVIPMTPFLIWIGALANWLVVVGEGIVAAPLWALAHLGAEGEGLGQRSMHGYLFLLNMATRPFLMVIGFFLGGGTLTVIGTFAIPAFEVAVANAQANSITGLFTILGYLYLFCQLFLGLTAKCFNLILLLPDTVLTWVGVQTSQRLGFEAGEVHGGFERGKDKTSGIHEKTGPTKAPTGMPSGNGFEV
jgi:conjugal transfer/type IV secretion protein DotA/TraY